MKRGNLKVKASEVTCWSNGGKESEGRCSTRMEMYCFSRVS